MNQSNILVLSNNCFSKGNSNGRTMMNMLKQIPKENLAQFYISGNPDMDFCNNYFQVSDQDAKNAFLLRKKVKKEDKPKDENKNKDKKPKEVKKNCKNLYIRNLVWRSYMWWKKDFDKFLQDFNPQIVLLQAGDSPFMYAIAMKIAKKYKCKLVMFNTENYVLKKYMYSSIKKKNFWHSLLQSALKKQYKKIMSCVDYCIYSCEGLEAAYQEAYPHPNKSDTIYTVSELDVLPDASGDPFTIVYCGNLGVGRDATLNRLAQIIYEVDPTVKLEIYGKFLSEEAEKVVCANENVVYKGFIDYEEIPAVMSRASMLLHCEHTGRLENLRYAFSTKIADSLASGRPFLVCATREYPFVQYLEENQCAHIASTATELKEVLKKCIDDKEYRYKYQENAKAVALKNHSEESNCQKLEKILEEL